MRPLALLLLLALAACATPEPVPDGPLTDRKACEQQAERDPSVREMIARNVGSQRFYGEDQDAMRAVKRSVVLSCLRARGVIQPGRVERVAP